MLRFLRKKGNMKKIMWGLALLIIPAFVLWGSGGSRDSKDMPRYAGKIFGKKVSFRDYEAQYLACRNDAILRYGQNLSRIAQFLDLEALTWQRLALLAEAQRQRIKVSDKEVVDLIRTMAIFQKEGRFDEAQYTTVLEYALRSSAREFEEQMRDALTIEKLREKVTRDITISDEEVQNDYKQKNEKAKVRYLLFLQDEFIDSVQPAHDELLEYFQNNKTQFEKEEQVNVEYMGFYFDQNLSSISVEVKEDEILSYYQEHKDEFTQEKDETLDEVDLESESQDEETFESTEAEEEPIEEMSEDTHDTIKERLIEQKQKEALEDRIWDIADQAADNPDDFAKIAKDNQLELKETGFFTSQGLIPEIGLSYEFLNTAFSLSPGAISNAIETPKGLFVMKLKEKKPAHVPPMEEVQPRVEDAVTKEKARTLAKEKAQSTLTQFIALIENDNLSFEKAADKLTLTFKESEEFIRGSYISGIGRADEFTNAAFSLEVDQISEVVAVPNGYGILSLKEIIPFDKEGFSQEKETLGARLLGQKKDQFYRVWVDNLLKRAHSEDLIAKMRSGEGS